jgi:hypothetical protein
MCGAGACSVRGLPVSHRRPRIVRRLPRHLPRHLPPATQTGTSRRLPRHLPASYLPRHEGALPTAVPAPLSRARVLSKITTHSHPYSRPSPFLPTGSDPLYGRACGRELYGMPHVTVDWTSRPLLPRQAGAYTSPLFCSTLAHSVGYVGRMISPQSIRQGDTGRCDQNSLG